MIFPFCPAPNPGYNPDAPNGSCLEIKQRLDSLADARQRLLAGANVVVIVDAFRSRVEYGRPDLPLLTAAIQRLTAEYNACIFKGRRTVALTRPLQFFF